MSSDAAISGVENTVQRFWLKLLRGPLEPLHSGSFGIFWVARLLSYLGSQASRVAILLLLAGSGAPVAAIGLLIWCEILPGAAAGFLSGSIVDRVSRRRLMIATDAARGITLVFAAAYPYPAVLLTVAAINSLASAFFNPARAATLPAIVPPELLTKANALDQSASTAVLIAGPFIGAWLYFHAGIRWALLADSASFLISTLLIAIAVPRAEQAAEQSASLWVDIQDGWLYLRRHPLPRTMLILSGISVLSVGLWIPLAASFIQTFLKAGEGVLAQQLTIFGVGGLCGAPFAAWAARRSGRGWLLASMLLAEAAAMLLYSRMPNVVGSGCIIFVWGMVVSGITVPFYSLLQDRVPDSHLGRVFAIHEQTESAGSAVAIIGPVMMHRLLAPQDMFALAGLLYLASVVLVLRSASGQELFRAR